MRPPSIQQLLAATLLVGLAAFSVPAQQRPPLRFNLASITPDICHSKGRLQDRFREAPVTIEILKHGKDSIPVLIDSLTDETATPNSVFCFWPETKVGDLALAFLSDLFTDPDYKTTVKGAGWDEMLERKDRDVPSWELLSRYVAKHGRTGLQAKWREFWVSTKWKVIWDEDCLCIRQPMPFPLEEEEAIREAVFRHQIEKWDLSAAAYCLSVEGKDPSKRFLGRFQDIRPPVKASSQCRKVGHVAGWSLRDRKTGKLAVQFKTSDVRRLSATTAAVGASYSCGSLCLRVLTYTVHKEGDRWIVKGEEVHLMASGSLLRRRAPFAPGFPPFEMAS